MNKLQLLCHSFFSRVSVFNSIWCFSDQGFFKTLYIQCLCVLSPLSYYTDSLIVILTILSLNKRHMRSVQISTLIS